MRARSSWATIIAALAAAGALARDAPAGWIAAAALVGLVSVVAPRGVARRLWPLAIVLAGVAATVALGTYGVPSGTLFSRP